MCRKISSSNLLDSSTATSTIIITAYFQLTFVFDVNCLAGGNCLNDGKPKFSIFLPLLFVDRVSMSAQEINKFGQLLDASFRPIFSTKFEDRQTDQQTYLPIEMQFYISMMFLGLPDNIHEENPSFFDFENK